jgi:hypothetical protein
MLTNNPVAEMPHRWGRIAGANFNHHRTLHAVQSVLLGRMLLLSMYIDPIPVIEHQNIRPRAPHCGRNGKSSIRQQFASSAIGSDPLAP